VKGLSIMIKLRTLLILLLLGIRTGSLLAQTGERYITRDFNQLSLQEFIRATEKRYNLKYFIVPDSLPELTVQITGDSAALSGLLSAHLEKSGYEVSVDHQGNVFLFRKTKIRTELPENYFFHQVKETGLPDSSMAVKADSGRFIKTRREYIPKTLTIGNKKDGVLLKRATIHGTVRRAEDGSSIPGATIYVSETGSGTVSDNGGIFTLTLPKGKYSLEFRSVDCEVEKYRVEVLSDGRMDITLTRKVIMMNEVTITSQANHNVRGIQMGLERMTIKEIKEVPVVMGERDIIRVALLLPGVKSSGEGSAGFNVRGSPADQNMFYINNVPVYNTSHIFGFFSAFNPDVISDFQLFKSSIPSRYGGRLSSVFEIQTRKGILNQFNLKGGISPVTSRLMTEIPVIRDKISLMMGFRSTYSDWLLNFIKVPEVNQSSGRFGDLTANLAIQANKNNQINLFAYGSYDRIRLASRINNDYSNRGVSLSWFHTFNANHDMDVNLISYLYNFSEDNYDYALSAYSLNYSLEHYEANARFHYRLSDRHTISYGISSVLYKVDNGTFEPFDDLSEIEPVIMSREKALESGIFLEDEWKVLPRLTLSGGIRYNDYEVLGAGEIFKYRENSRLTPENITDTLTFEENEVIRSYQNLNYRASVNFLVNNNISLKFSYNTLSQNIFMLSNTIAISPSDKWKLCDYNIEPMTGNQVSAGIYSNLLGGMYEVSLEGYYKKTNHLPEYRDGARLIANEHPEQDILPGKLDAFGLELMIRKSTGRLNGWFNYSYSGSGVVVNNKITGEQTNFGKRYPSNYDQPHSLNLVTNYKFSKRVSASGSVVYSTGRPATYPTAVYYLDGQRIVSYSYRNEYRIPDYFRVDLSLTYEGNLKKKKAVHGSWVLSVYNLTGRNNAYSVYFKSENGLIKGYKMSVFATPIFSITYDFKLGNYAK